MYYSINKYIFLVNGLRYNCIYDLPNNKLHKIGTKAFNVLLRVVEGKEIINPDELAFLEALSKLGIVAETNTPTYDYKSIDQVYSYPRALDFAWIEITNKCNLRCIHCYNEQDTCAKVFMSLEDFKFVVDQLCSVGIKKIQLIGGEPFLMDKKILFEMMDYLSLRVKGFELFTNGTLAEKRDWQEIKDRYPNVSVATSLHSFIEEEHERVTKVKGSFKKSEQTLKCLKSLRIPYRFVGTLIGGITIGKNDEIGQPSRRDYVRLAGRANLSLYNDDLLKQRIITERTLHAGDLRTRLKTIYEESCFASHLYIGSDLNVYPCPMERRLYHGNLRDNDLKNLLDNKILNLSKSSVNGCKDCEYRYICRDCRPDSLTGELSEKPWYCTYDPYMGEWETFEEFKNRIYVE